MQFPIIRYSYFLYGKRLRSFMEAYATAGIEVRGNFPRMKSPVNCPTNMYVGVQQFLRALDKFKHNKFRSNNRKNDPTVGPLAQTGENSAADFWVQPQPSSIAPSLTSALQTLEKPLRKIAINDCTVSGCYTPWKRWDGNGWDSWSCSKIHRDLNSHPLQNTNGQVLLYWEDRRRERSYNKVEWRITHSKGESFHPVLTFQQLLRIQLQRQLSLHDSTMHQLFLSLFPHLFPPKPSHRPDYDRLPGAST